MIIKANRHTFLGLVILIICVIGYVWFVNSSYFKSLAEWTQQNLILFSATLVLVKILSIIIPPLPGGLITLASIPLIGWQMAYLADFAGTVLGSSGAYFLGKKYGFALLGKLFDENVLNQIKKIKVKSHREIEAILVMRVLLGATLIEAVCFGAGLLKIRYPNFLIGTIIAHLLVGVPLFYLANNLINFKNTPLTIAIIALAVIIFWRVKGRYFE